MFRPFLVILLGLLWALPAQAGRPAPEAAESLDSSAVCARLTEAAEAALELPPHLLGAIAKVESGRWDPARRARVAWPWTVMAEGRGRYLPSKAAAVAEVRALQAKGVRNIDVGCMQVNLMYHGQRFADLEAALDPVQNVAYAATFLVSLHQDLGSWTRAIGRYHSATPRYSGRYRLKVFRAWRADKRAAYAEAREARRKARPLVPAATGKPLIPGL